MPVTRSAAVAIAVTLQRLSVRAQSSWTVEQELVLDALRRCTPRLAEASEAELGAYIRALAPEQSRGLVSNVKGVLHEILVARAENLDGDAVVARLFEELDHPGADLEFVLDDHVIAEVQLKAVQDPAALLEHFARYPDINVMATSEIVEAMGGVFGGRLSDSGLRNDEIAELTRDTLEELAEEDLGEFVEEGVVASALIGAALQARAVLQGRAPDAGHLRSTLELAGVAAGTAASMDVLLNLV